jgi:anthranilate synthase component I
VTLYHPSEAEFCALATEHRVVPVYREVLADLDTPLGVYDRLASEGTPSFLLESVEHGERWGRYSFIGRNPFLEFVARDGRVELTGDVPEHAAEVARTGDPLATLEALLSEFRAPQIPGLPPMYCGAVGYLGWDVVRFIERLPDAPADDLGFDDARLLFPGQLVAFDHLRQRLLVVSNVVVGEDPAAAYRRAVEDSERLVARLATPVAAPPVAPPTAVQVDDAVSNMSPEAYLDGVRRAKEHIAAGDIFQVVPSQRFSLETDADPFTVYRVLRVINPSPYMYLFAWDDLHIVGSSPEALVKHTGGTATIWPIAGSRPRGADEAEDAAMASSLLADEKERAEHVMLVDLARNDLGRVCELGSVKVTDFMSLVRYSHIMHLHSEVSGTVRDGVGPIDVLRATFPAGTLSGAPKVRAMEIIDDLEPTRRGPFGGGIGYIDLAGNMDLCIAIRTLLLTGGRAYVQAGAGLVADSVPETEFEETRNKAMALLAAIRSAEAMTGGDRSR